MDKDKSMYGRAGARASSWGRSPMVKTNANRSRFEGDKMDQVEKEQIDAMNYEELLRRWRFSPSGDPLFQGDRGEYFLERMTEARRLVGDKAHAEASRRIGWSPDMRKAPRLSLERKHE